MNANLNLTIRINGKDFRTFDALKEHLELVSYNTPTRVQITVDSSMPGMGGGEIRLCRSNDQIIKAVMTTLKREYGDLLPKNPVRKIEYEETEERDSSDKLDRLEDGPRKEVSNVRSLPLHKR